MLHNPVDYPDSETFKPDRFLRDGVLNPDVPSPMNVAFGFGRRICPGRYMARDAVWIAIASILATFEIRKALDEKGNDVEPLDGCVPGVVS